MANRADGKTPEVMHHRHYRDRHYRLDSDAWEPATRPAFPLGAAAPSGAAANKHRGVAGAVVTRANVPGART